MDTNFQKTIAKHSLLRYMFSEIRRLGFPRRFYLNTREIGELITKYLPQRDFLNYLYRYRVKDLSLPDEFIDIQAINIIWSENCYEDYNLRVVLIINNVKLQLDIILSGPKKAKLARVFQKLQRYDLSQFTKMRCMIRNLQTRQFNSKINITNILCFKKEDILDQTKKTRVLKVMHHEYLSEIPYAKISVGSRYLYTPLSNDDIMKILEIKKEYLPEMEYALLELDVLSAL